MGEELISCTPPVLMELVPAIFNSLSKALILIQMKRNFDPSLTPLFRNPCEFQVKRSWRKIFRPSFAKGGREYPLYGFLFGLTPVTRFYKHQ